MFDWEKEEENSEGTISLEELADMEHKKERDDPSYDEMNWGESFDDMDGEAWERQYDQGDKDLLEDDPWDLD